MILNQACRRHSTAKAIAVDIARTCFTNIREAAGYMARHDVPLEVARRVLLRPEQRRNYP